MPIKNDANVRRTVDAKKIVFRFEFIFKGNVGVPQLVVGINTANSEKSQMANKTERKR
jgi:hypothetical protein